MQTSLEQLIQQFEQITQQLKALESIFKQSCNKRFVDANDAQLLCAKADSNPTNSLQPFD